MLGGTTGLLAGSVGQGGAFIIIPLLIYILKIPTRIAIGSTVVIAVLSALAGLLGKWGTGQIPVLWALLVAIGSLLGGQLGGRLSYRLTPASLEKILAFLVGGTALKMWYQFFTK